MTESKPIIILEDNAAKLDKDLEIICLEFDLYGEHVCI